MSRFKNVYGAPPREDQQWYSDALIRLEAARQHFVLQKRALPFWLTHLSRNLFPDKPVELRRRLLILHGCYRLIRDSQNGDALLENLPEGAGLWDLVVAAAIVLHVPKYFLAQTLGIHRSERWKKGTDKLAQLPQILAIFNLLGVQKPWEALLKIFPEELNWAFKVRRMPDGQLVFETENIPDLVQLATGGFGSVLNIERIARGITWKKLNGHLEDRLDRSINFTMLTRYGTNEWQPPFQRLRALFEILQTLPPKRPLFRSDFLLSAYPTLIGLLPLFSSETNTWLNTPQPAPYREATYPAPRTHRMQILTRQPTLDPKGFPFLVRSRRVAMGLDAARAGGIL